jgi:queuine tRNA-ribosyltransferase
VFRFEIQAVCPETGARAGILHTAHGDVETPVFMPVGTQAAVKGVLNRDLAGELDAKIILSNTYHLFLRPGHETIRKLGGLHQFMSWPRAILTDSGGFQVFSLDGLRRVTEEGVLFRSHLNGDPHMFTPQSTIDVQLALGSDIMMVLDECLAYPASHESTIKEQAPTASAPAFPSCRDPCLRSCGSIARSNCWNWRPKVTPSAAFPSASRGN